MIISERLRFLREQKKLSQGDIEQRTGLMRCYISRVENGHTFPAVETLEKIARALEMPLYQLLYEGEKPPEAIGSQENITSDKGWGTEGKHVRLLAKLRRNLSRMNMRDRQLVMSVASYMASRRSRTISK
jgi:transcriptional regulator with XRE-family HTH domain